MSYIINIGLRNQTFYLIKKYTSYSQLKKSYLLEKSFIDTFECQLRNPSENILAATTEYTLARHENEYVSFLSGLINFENALKQLMVNTNKAEVYYSLFEKGGGSLFGRYADEKGLEDDIFYQTLGLGKSHGYIYKKYDHTKFVENILFSSEFIWLSSITINDGEYVIPNEYKIYNKWSYESLFGAKHWPLFRNFPAYIESAPDFNLNAQDEIASGEEIITTGIYEPWFSKPVYQSLSNDPDYNPYVGCPNYFLDGAIATQYKLEGTEDWYEVKWRLIWTDQRYVDGLILEEEQFYNFDLETTSQSEPPIQPTIKIKAGQPSPKTGYWTTPAKPDHRQYIQ